MGFKREYQIRVYDQSTGDLTGWYNDGISLEYTKVVNNVGMCLWTVKSDHPVISLIGEDDRVEIYLNETSNQQGNYTLFSLDYTGLYREKQIATDQAGNEYVVLYIPSTEDILARAIIAYTAGTTDRTEFTFSTISTIMGNIYKYNATSLGTTVDGRERDAIAYLSTTPTGTPSGNQIDYRSAWKNVLEAMRELASLNGDQFKVGRNTFTNALFVHYNSHTDRSDDVIFGYPLGNLRSGSLSENKLNEKTVAIVGGGGQESSRAIRVRTGTNQSSTNNYETFVDARDTTTTDVLDSRGDVVLAAKEAKAEVSVDIVSTPGYSYMDDFNLGDTVSDYFNGALTEKCICEVTVTFDPGFSVELKAKSI